MWRYFMSLLFVFLATRANCKTVAENEHESCASNERNSYKLFGTKTPYETVSGKTHPQNECTPIMLWLLSRHGTRYATVHNMASMKSVVQLHEELLSNFDSRAGTLCESDSAILRSWQWDEIAERKAELLNAQGWRDLFEMGQRFRRLYPALFAGDYSEERYVFGHTSTNRTRQSCEAFVEGALGADANVTLEDAMEIDTIAKPYRFCPAWNEEVSHNNETFAEHMRFVQSPPYAKMQRDLSRRLGFSRTLEADEIQAMYDNCRMDRARFLDKVSPWCLVFTDDELQLLEYASDLMRYYHSGPGHEYHAKLGCMPLRNLRDTFAEKTRDNASDIEVVAMFTHDTMLDMVFATLGYGADEGFNLMADAYEERPVDRKYRTSVNLPFAANIAAILFRCSEGPDQYVVQLMHNENPMELKECPAGKCSWDHLNDYLSFTKECNLDFCD